MCEGGGGGEEKWGKVNNYTSHLTLYIQPWWLKLRSHNALNLTDLWGQMTRWRN